MYILFSLTRRDENVECDKINLYFPRRASCGEPAAQGRHSALWLLLCGLCVSDILSDFIAGLVRRCLRQWRAASLLILYRKNMSENLLHLFEEED